MRPVRHLAVTLALGVAACGMPSAPAPRTRSVAVDLPEVPVHARFEVKFDVAARSRETDDVAIVARFTAPSGAVTKVGGFASHGAFLSRFTPREVGRHSYVIRADGGGGERDVASGAFLATASRRPGFVRADPDHPHRLVHDDGTTVFVLGENRINVYDPTWNFGELGTAAYVARMAGYGMTTIRVFLFADCESESAGGYQIGCLEKGVGRFDERTADAIDTLFDAAENNGVHVILVASAIGYTPGPETWRSWVDNPYSKERGGPAASPIDYFRDPALRRHAARKLRYIADRWASSTRLLAVDLLNEPEWDGQIPEAVWIPWAEEMSDAWKEMDPYRHLVTAGPVGLHWNVGPVDERPWYASPKSDVVQWHLYGKPFYDPHALGLEMTRKVDETWGFGKPIVCGEFGYGGEDTSTYDHTHVGIWSLLFSGAGALAHTAPPFEIDSDEPMTPQRGAHFRVLSGLLRSFDPRVALAPRKDVALITPEAALAFTRPLAKGRGATDGAGALAAPEAPHPGRALTLASEDGSLRAIWVHAAELGYGTPVTGASVRFPSPPAGPYRVRWIDDVTGAVLEDAAVTASGSGTLTLRVPTFTRHTAARLAPARSASQTPP